MPDELIARLDQTDDGPYALAELKAFYLNKEMYRKEDEQRRKMDEQMEEAKRAAGGMKNRGPRRPR